MCSPTIDDLYLIIILFDISQFSLVADDTLLLSYLILSCLSIPYSYISNVRECVF